MRFQSTSFLKRRISRVSHHLLLRNSPEVPQNLGDPSVLRGFRPLRKRLARPQNAIQQASMLERLFKAPQTGQANLISTRAHGMPWPCAWYTPRPRDSPRQLPLARKARPLPRHGVLVGQQQGVMCGAHRVRQRLHGPVARRNGPSTHRFSLCAPFQGPLRLSRCDSAMGRRQL